MPNVLKRSAPNQDLTRSSYYDIRRIILDTLGIEIRRDMVFQIQKVSNYGTATPAVARTFYQGCELLGFFAVTEQQREDAKGILRELQRHLVRCVELRDAIAHEVTAAHKMKANGFQYQSSGRVVTLPSVPNLQSRAESFLQSTKLAIRETALLVKPFYGEKLDHRFHRFAAWSETQFGPDDAFTQAVRKWEPWVKNVVDMRNAVDHPDDKPGGRLTTQNFALGGTPEAPRLINPTWGLSGHPQQLIITEMSELIEGGIELGEEILAGLFYKLKHNFSLVIYEIPAEERDPSCPIRLRVGFSSNTEHA